MPTIRNGVGRIQYVIHLNVFPIMFFCLINIETIDDLEAQLSLTLKQNRILEQSLIDADNEVGFNHFLPTIILGRPYIFTAILYFALAFAGNYDFVCIMYHFRKILFASWLFFVSYNNCTLTHTYLFWSYFLNGFMFRSQTRNLTLLQQKCNQSCEGNKY